MPSRRTRPAMADHPLTDPAPPPSAAQRPHRMRLSLRRNRQLVVWCTCQADTNDQRRDPAAEVPSKMFHWDYLAVIDVTDSAVAVFREHVRAAAS